MKETRVNPTLPTLQADEEKRTLFGYGAVFDSLSQDLGGFKEIIDKRAFNRTLANGNDILVALNHDVSKLLGRTSAGTARVFADDIGVRYEVDVPNTTAGNDVLELTKRGDIHGSSFTFSVTESGSEWRTDDKGQRIRQLNEVRLYELGPVVSPAYLDTTVAARSLEQIEDTSDDESEDDGTQETTVTAARQLLRVIR